MIKRDRVSKETGWVWFLLVQGSDDRQSRCCNWPLSPTLFAAWYCSLTEVTIDKEFNIKFEDDRILAQEKADELLDLCDAKIRKQWGNMDPLQLVDAITDCMEVQVNETLSKQEEERSFQSSLRQQMSRELVPYACGDVNFTNTNEVVNRSWSFDENTGDGPRKFQLQVYHERPNSQIFRIQNFTRPEECKSLKYFISPDESQIPFVTVNDMTKQGRLVHTLASKFYEVARIALNWPELEFQNQFEDHGVELLDIHRDKNGMTVLPPCTKEDLEGYDASDPKSTPPQTCLMPGAARVKVPTKHFEVKKPNELATVFLFCGQGEKAPLGGIHFPDAGVHINREPNMLVMAIHRYLDDPVMDGYTTDYHFCPNYDIFTHTIHVKEDAKQASAQTTGSETKPSSPPGDEDLKDEL